MTSEFKIFIKDMDAAFFRYAHLSGAVEIYMLILESKDLQKSFSKILTNQETEWKKIHRYMVINNQTTVWYPELPINSILSEKNSLLGFLYGITLGSFVASFDYYLSSILVKQYGIKNTTGNSWKRFSEITNIRLDNFENSKFIYTLIQERHKIEHNKARIDNKFLANMNLMGVEHVYTIGDSIQKSHIDILLTNDIIRKFTNDIDVALRK